MYFNSLKNTFLLLFDKEHQCHTCLSYLFAFWPDNMTFHDNILNLQHHQSSSAVTISHFQYMIIVAKRIHDYDVMTNLFKKKKCKSVKFTFNFVDCMLCLFFFFSITLKLWLKCREVCNHNYRKTYKTNNYTYWIVKRQPD